MMVDIDEKMVEIDEKRVDELLERFYNHIRPFVVKEMVSPMEMVRLSSSLNRLSVIAVLGEGQRVVYNE